MAGIRAAGIAHTQAELDEDITGLAAPIRDAAGGVVAAISIAALTRRATPAGVVAMQDTLRAAAQAVQDRLAAAPGLAQS
jgi:IclR family acetate operon transcriptional repressor